MHTTLALWVAQSEHVTVPLQSVPVLQATELILWLAEKVNCVAAPALLQLRAKRWRSSQRHAALHLCGVSAAGQQLLPAVHAAPLRHKPRTSRGAKP